MGASVAAVDPCTKGTDRRVAASHCGAGTGICNPDGRNHASMVGHEYSAVQATERAEKENLRYNMSTLELMLNMLAETTTTELTKNAKSPGLDRKPGRH